MSSDDSSFTRYWAPILLSSQFETEGGGSVYPGLQEYDISFYASAETSLNLDDGGLGLIRFAPDANSSIDIEPKSSFHHSSQNHHFESSSQTGVKPTPRLDVQVEPRTMGYQYESSSLSPSTWNAPPSSASTETTSSYYSPYDQHYSYDSESPQSSTQSHYSELIGGHPCAYSPGSENDTGRHVSELTTFPYQAPIECTSMPACTLFPETLWSKYEADPQHLPCHFEHLPLKKTTVASPRVLTASRSRRRPSKQGAKLYRCTRPECNGTFTARHNLINHMNSHSGVRPYPCIEQCGQSFGTRHVLIRHQKTCQTLKLVC